MPADSTLTAQDRADARPLPSVELEPDSPFGRYVIRHKLGAGGMGVVYAAWDAELDRDVALKIIRPIGNVNAKHARLRREARAMARLSHPNVVPVFDIGTHHGQLFIAMELVRGPSLRTWVRSMSEAAETVPGDTDRDTRGDSDPARKRLTSPGWREVVRVFVDAGRGLIAAHEGGVMHRDFKPDNVLVGRNGHARITDFGLARELAIADPDTSTLPLGDDAPSDAPSDDLAALDGDRPLSLTATGGCSGTPAYMAPELLRGATGDAKTDQFSFCVSLFEVLYGERPFRVRAAETTLFDEILGGKIIEPAERHAVPGWLHAIVVRGLAVEPDGRWPSLAELLSALEDGLARRRRVAIAGVAAVAALGIGALIASRTSAPAAGPGCMAIKRAGHAGLAITVCKDEYARTRDPQIGAALADALFDTRNLHDASLVASELLATPARGEALYVLGNVAAREGRHDEAVRSFGLARDAHCAANAQRCALDWLALAGEAVDPIEQLGALDHAASYARLARDPQTEGYIAVATALPLSLIGARAGAQHSLDRAAALMTSADAQLQLARTRGDVEQNLGDNARAAATFKAALDQVPGSTHRALSMQLNLVYSLAESGQLSEAQRALADADALDPGDHEPERFAVAARVAWRSNDLVRAAELAERALRQTPPGEDDDRIERETLRAEIALAAHQPDVAEAHARQAIAQLEAQRAEIPAPAALRAWLIRDHRVPYEQVFAALAERGDAAGALAAREQVRGLDLLAALFADDRGDVRIGDDVPIARLAEDLSALATSPLASAPAPSTADDDAVVLAVAHDTLWRITRIAGTLAIERLGTMAELGPRLRGGTVLAAPPALLRSDKPIAVVLDAALAWLPESALGLHRPILRPARLGDLPCHASPPTDALVRVVARLGARAWLGSAALGRACNP